MIKLLNKTCHNCGADTSHDTSVKVAYKCPNQLCNVYQRGNECETYGVNPSVEQEKKYGGFVVHQTEWKQSFCKVHGSGGTLEFYCETHDDSGCTGVMCEVNIKVFPSIWCNECDVEDGYVCMQCERNQKESYAKTNQQNQS